jgi:5-methyltetrahydrofolate--homocysteine methyltransferase
MTDQRPALLDFWGHLVLVGDGAMGTMIQAADPSADDYQGFEGCPEILNVSRPDLISDIHRAYLDAGSDIIGTNTFGANLTALGEYGLADRLEELAAAGARLARRAADVAGTPGRPRFVAGSLGPGTKLPTLGQVAYADLKAGYETAARGLITGGVDLILVETCPDVLLAKAAVNGVRAARRALAADTPIVVHVTVETTGTLLVGAEIGAVVASLLPLGVDGLGLNCATGPGEMGEHLRYLGEHAPVHLSVMPNAGLPQLTAQGALYPLGPDEFADLVARHAADYGLALVGGCCGTTPDHIRALASAVAGRTVSSRVVEPIGAVASTYSAVDLTQDVSYLAVGERANANGSRAFRDAMTEGRWDDCVAIAREQVRDGAHVIDLSVDWVGRDGTGDMAELAARCATGVAAPLMIDSTEPAVIQAALERLPGRSLVNSVNFEDGAGPDSRYRRIMAIAKEHGAAVVALCIDEEGQARTARRKVEVARRLIDDLTSTYALSWRDIVVDCLTFPIATGQDETRRDAIATIEAIAELNREYPGLHTVLGVSNVSFGLNPAARRVLNSVFLAECRAVGLDTAIVHPGRIVPLASLPEEARQVAEDLVWDRRRAGYDPLERLLELFAGVTVADQAADRAAALRALSVGERLRYRIVEAETGGLETDLAEALTTTSAVDILNGDLLVAMKTVGERFGSGQMQLPFVLKSAEAMKRAVDFLEPHLGRSAAQGKGTLVLATVRGDVHDIGKNLVDIIVSNNGYEVVNLGIKQPLGAIVEAAEQHQADAIGLSGLLVKSTQIMRDNLLELNQRGLAGRYPVLLGGAALTRSYVEEDLSQVYEGEVRYARDAFEGLRLMDAIMAFKRGEPGAAFPSHRPRRSTAPLSPGPGATVSPALDPRPARSAVTRPVPGGVDVPTPPWWGSRVVKGLSLDEIAGWLDERALFAGRWGLKSTRGGPTYDDLVASDGQPHLRRWLDLVHTDRLADFGVVYGYWPCYADGSDLVVLDPVAGTDGDLADHRTVARFEFPRQDREPWLCLADYFRDHREATDHGPDVLPLQLVTMGSRIAEETAQLFTAGAYRDYLELHGLSVQLTEALAELWHTRVRRELGLPERSAERADLIGRQAYVGRRYSFGYPACPDLAQRAGLVGVLDPSRIGVTLSEEHQLHPEQSTDALIVHHPEARYFSV